MIEDPLDANRHYGKAKHSHKYVIEIEWSITGRAAGTYKYNVGKAKLEHDAERLFNKAVRDRMRYGKGIVRLYEDGILIKTINVSELNT